MKSIQFKRQFLLILGFFVILSSMIGMSCSGKNSPASPTPPAAPTATPTITATPISVRWSAATISKTNNFGTVTQYLQLDISVADQAVTTVTVFLSGSNVTTPVTLTYNSNVTFSGVPYAVYTNSGTSWTYVAGQTYSLTSISTAGTASATLTAPGGTTFAANGSAVTWVSGGIEDSVVVNLGATTTYSSGGSVALSSPYSIPATAYSSFGTYDVTVDTLNQTSSVSGIIAGTFSVDEIDEKAFTFNAPTATPTSTPTITLTSTMTLTPTRTFSFTPSFTPTITNTFTTTPTGTLTPVPTNTPSATPTITLTSTLTFTPTLTPTETATITTTNTSTDTPTITSTATASPTITSSPTSTPTGAHWRFAGPEGIAGGGDPLLALSGGNVLMDYLDANTGYSAIVTFGGTNWSAPTENSSGFFQSSFYVDSVTGTAYTAFSDGSINDFLSVMKETGGTWSYVGPGGFSTGAVYNPSLYVFDNGVTVIPYVAFGDDTNSNKTTVMLFNGTNWVNVGSGVVSPGSADMNSLVVNTDGTPYVAYRDDSISPAKITVMGYVSSTWTAIGGADFTPQAQYPSLAVYSNKLYLAFQDGNYSGGQASVMTYSLPGPGSWSYLGSGGFTGTAADYESIYIDSGGIPYVAFNDWNDTLQRAWVMKYVGGIWSTVGVQDFSPGSAKYLSIVVNSGIPYVAFTDGNTTSGYAGSVMYYQ